MSDLSPSAIARRWFEEVWNQRRDETIDELASPDVKAHMKHGELNGREQVRAVRDHILKLVQDFRIEVEDAISEGDKGAVRWRASAEINGKKFGFAGMSWIRVQNGRIVEGWDEWDPTVFNQAVVEAYGAAALQSL